MALEKISAINDKVDIKLFFHITRRNIIYIIVFFTLALTCAYIYLRYTHPIYKASVVLQIGNGEDDSPKLINYQQMQYNYYTNYFTLPRRVQLLRSGNFLTRVMGKLPLEVTYYKKGAIMNLEEYRTTPYEVVAKVKDGLIYGIPIYINFVGGNRYSISYELKNLGIRDNELESKDTIQSSKLKHKTSNLEQNVRKGEFFLTEKVDFPEVELEVKLLDYNKIKRGESFFNGGGYFFVLNNPDQIVQLSLVNLDIHVLDNTAQTIGIFCTAKNAIKVSDIVNTIATEFQKYDVEVKGESVEKTLKYIDEQLGTTFDTLNALQKRIENFKSDHGLDSNGRRINLSGFESLIDLEIRKTERELGDSINQPINQASLFFNSKAEIRNLYMQLEGIEYEIKSLNEFERSLTEGVDIDVYKISAIANQRIVNGEGGVNTNLQSPITNLQSQLYNLLLEKEILKQDYTENSASMSALDFQIDLEKKLIIENIKNEKRVQITRLLDLQNRMREVLKTMENPNRLSEEDLYCIFELHNLKRMFELNNKYYNALIEEKVQYSISKAGFVSQNVILQSAKTPKIPISPDKQLAYIVSFVLGTIISLALIFIKYIFYNEITSLNDIAKYTDAPLLGMIPNYRKSIPVSQLIINKKSKSMMAECLRAIRTNIQFISNEPGPKIIAVTSTISREGKTFFTINFAGILAISDKKVLIIDFDMRKPKIHVGFDCENTRGVSTILVGKDSPGDCILHTKFSNLDIITAGPVPPNPSELILNKHMDEMIQYLKSKYDFIIIDTPPLGLVTDAMKPFQIADYPIYILKANYSKRIFIQNIIRLINENNIKKLSVILNAVEPQYSTYGYQGYGYSGYNYGNYGYTPYGYGYYDSE